MAVSESRRHDLYNGLTQILGPDLTDTLMSYLPTAPTASLVAREEFQVEIRALKEEIRHLSERIDRLQQILVAGFVSMIIALIVVGFFD